MHIRCPTPLTVCQHCMYGVSHSVTRTASRTASHLRRHRYSVTRTAQHARRSTYVATHKTSHAPRRMYGVACTASHARRRTHGVARTFWLTQGRHFITGIRYFFAFIDFFSCHIFPSCPCLCKHQTCRREPILVGLYYHLNLGFILACIGF